MDIFMQVLGYIGAIGIAFFSFPEIIRCFKSKSTVNVNVWLFGLLAVSSACFWITGFYNVSKDVAAGNDFSFGLAVAIANVFSFLSPVIILFYKLINVLAAKKHGMNEKEYQEFKKVK
ncbi:MAG: hypothetical protein K2H56_02970 [Malacoplasma sp.]|nr:hypothetical protein [Malacoplasma sp.]